MAMSTVTRMVWAVLLPACFFPSIAIAQGDVVAPTNELPSLLSENSMMLSLRPSDSAPVSEEYSVAPLTTEAGLRQTAYGGDYTPEDPQPTVRGNMMLVDQFNYNSINGSDTVAFLSCDKNSENDSYISPSDMLIALVDSNIKAILLYSIDNELCTLSSPGFDSHSIWTMTMSMEAASARDSANVSTGTMIATITSTGSSLGPDGFQPARPEGGSNSAIAMSILYSITGIITLLFLVIIGSGAIRAHRHPERYGPRPGYGGRPRQSRAKGLARAVLDTLPIVKFGDSRSTKPDPEHELESTTGDRHQENRHAPDEAPAESVHQQTTPSEEISANKPVSETAAPVASQETRSSTEGADDDHVGCSICTEDFTVGEDVRVLPCDHKFHPQCVDPWLVNVSGTCPLCRLDLRPQNTAEGQATSAPASRDGAAEVDGHLAPPPEADIADLNATQRRRRSRLLDWNRLRHAPVDERIQALRQYRQTQEASASVSSAGPADDQNRHTRLTDRLREKFHIRTRRQAQSLDEASSNGPSTPVEVSRAQ